jgi:hypothetical protein
MCSQRKQAVSAPAEELYTAPFFQAARGLANRHSTRWFVISGKHGLLHPKTLVHPYDFDLGETSEQFREAWANDVVAHLLQHASREAVVVILANRTYSDPLKNELFSEGMRHDIVSLDDASSWSLEEALRRLEPVVRVLG